MLNDLFSIERGMAAYGVGFVAQHPDIKDMAKGGAFHVRLGADGRVDALGFITDSGRGALWTLRDGQHNGFPGLKTAAGLLILDDDARAEHGRSWDADKTEPARRKELLRLIQTCPIDGVNAASWPNAGHRKRIAERLAQLAPLRDDPATAAVPAAFERFLRALAAAPSFAEKLTEAIRDRLENAGDEWLAPARDALLGPVALMIDVAEDDFGRDARDIAQIGPVSEALRAGAEDTAASASCCALTGKAARLHAGNFPQPNLPGIGQTYIFSRNSDIPSLTRYGRTADASFAIGAELAGRLSGAVTYLTRDDAKGKSWRLIPGETGDKPDLMIASCVATPQARLADELAEDVFDEADFEEKTAHVIDQSNAVYERAGPESDVILLVLRAVDPANRKVVYHRRTTAGDFYDAARDWRRAATKNAPPWLGFYTPASPKHRIEKAGVRRPPHVAPLSLTRLSRILFVEGGQRRVDLIGLSAATAFELFLREGDVRRRAREALRLLLTRHGALLSGITQANRKGRERLQSFDPSLDLRLDALRSVTWLGALLHRLGRAREVYMSSAAFRLGQLLAAADVVHIGYCVDRRGGDIPPTLLGNSVFTIAGSNPSRALSILQQRWKPYDAWAKPRPPLQEKIDAIFHRSKPLREEAERLQRESGGKEASKLQKQAEAIEAPGWAMRNGLSQARRIREICLSLEEELKLEDVSDGFRAELLLGYMAGLPPVQKIDDGV